MATFTLHVRYLVAAAVAVISAACAPIPVGTPLNSSAAATTPTLAVGDSWTYRVRDAYTGIERGTERYTVDQANGGRVVLTVVPASGVEQMQVYDSQLNWLKRPATNLQEFSYSPAYPAFNFPLTPGKTWQTRLNATDPANGKNYPVRVDGSVVGWERVKVPAGEFDTLKIQRIVYFGYWVSALRGPSQIIEYEWYAPTVKQAVRREVQSQYRNILGAIATGFVRVSSGDDGKDDGPRYIQEDWLVSELVSYSVR
jgi:hypothetical protein